MEKEEINTSFLTDDEVEDLNIDPAKLDESETTSGEEKVDIQEPSTPEAEPKEKVEAQPPKEEKVEAEPVEPKPEPRPEGILTKDGKNVIPFTVLEKERAERQRLAEELAELKKPKVEPKAEPRVEKQPEAKPEIDFKAIADKAYESVEGMAEALQTMYEAGKKAAETVAPSAVQKIVTAEKYSEKVEKIKTDNPWIKGPVEDFIVDLASRKMRSDPTFNGNDLNSLVRITEEAVNEVKGMLSPQAPVDEKKIRQDEREKVTAELMKKFNITKPKVNTLGSIRNADPNIEDKFESIQAKTGIEYEEAMRELTPRERELFAERLEAGG